MSEAEQRAALATAAAELVDSARFTPARLATGYDMDQVDSFLDDIVHLIEMGHPIEDAVATVRFRPTRFREGYSCDEVDRFLERIAALVAAGVPDGTATGRDEHEVGRLRSQDQAGAEGADTSGLPSVIEEQRGLLARIFSKGD